MLRNVCDPADCPPTTASKAAAYQSDQRTASERIRKLTSRPPRGEQKPRGLWSDIRTSAHQQRAKTTRPNEVMRALANAARKKHAPRETMCASGKRSGQKPRFLPAIDGVMSAESAQRLSAKSKAAATFSQSKNRANAADRFVRTPADSQRARASGRVPDSSLRQA